MVTLILLVVLGGGAGLLAVSLSDHRAPWALVGRRRSASLRRAPTRGTSPSADAATGGRSAAPTRGTAASSGEVVAGGRAYRRVTASPRTTAVEGPWIDVARVPWWRRLVSLGLIVVIVGLVGAGLALAAGFAIATVAELVNGAIG